jgi:hypothetical protein
LEIAKQDDEGVRDAMWEAALSGGLTVKSARKRKEREPSSERSPRTVIPFKASNATVTVVFAQEEVDPQEVVDALSQALEEAQSMLHKAASRD